MTCKRGVVARRRHKEVLKQAKGYCGAVACFRVEQAIVKPTSMRTVTAATASANSVRCGFSVSMLVRVSTACLTAALLAV